MKIVCATGVEEVGADLPDLLVLPERTSIAELTTAMTRWPDAVIVGAAEEGLYVRGYVLKNGKNNIDYRKFSTDGTSTGTLDALSIKCMYESGDIALGVLICKDFQQLDLRAHVMERLASSQARLKVVCIPADMDSEWFPSDPVQDFIGAYVAMSNNRRTPNHTRRSSFIAGLDGACLINQSSYESISLNAP